MNNLLRLQRVREDEQVSEVKEPMIEELQYAFHSEGRVFDDNNFIGQGYRDLFKLAKSKVFFSEQ